MDKRFTLGISLRGGYNFSARKLFSVEITVQNVSRLRLFPTHLAKVIPLIFFSVNLVQLVFSFSSFYFYFFGCLTFSFPLYLFETFSLSELASASYSLKPNKIKTLIDPTT